MCWGVKRGIQITVQINEFSGGEHSGSEMQIASGGRNWKKNFNKGQMGGKRGQVSSKRRIFESVAEINTLGVIAL